MQLTARDFSLSLIRRSNWWGYNRRQFRTDFVIISAYRRAIHAELLCNEAFIAHAGVLFQVSGKLLLLGTDAVRIFR